MLPRLRHAGIGIATLLSFTHAAWAQNVPDVPVEEQTGHLYRKCLDAEHVRESLRQGRTPSEGKQIALAMAVGSCEGYIQGYIDGLSFGSYSEVRRDYKLCIPESVTLAQVYAVFREYARAHPEKHHWPRAWGLNDALHEAFPCK